ncbi:DUF21 domain-containing protein, partial [archaeon]
GQPAAMYAAVGQRGCQLAHGHLYVLHRAASGRACACTPACARRALCAVTADLTSGLVGFVVSTFLIVILGEVIPQAACSRHALLLGARFVPVVRVIIFLIWPLAKPISMVLDWWLGEEIGIFYSRQEFHKLVMMHAQTNRLDQQEAAIMSGAVTYRDKRAKDVMTPVSKLFALKSSDRLDYALMSTVRLP